MDRLRENIAIEAIACQQNLLFTVDMNYSISYFCLLEEHTKFVNSCKICIFVLPASKSLADFPSSAQMVKKLISPPSFSTVQAQLKHDWHSIEKDAGLFCYLETNRQCRFPMLDATNRITISTHHVCPGIICKVSLLTTRQTRQQYYSLHHYQCRWTSSYRIETSWKTIYWHISLLLKAHLTHSIEL